MLSDDLNPAQAITSSAPKYTVDEGHLMLEIFRDFLAPSQLELYGYQKDGVEWLLNRKRGLFADDLGLGKTPMTLCTMNILDAYCAANNFPLLPLVLCCPPSVVGTWEDEIQKWSTSTRSENSRIAIISKPRQRLGPEALTLILTYDRLKKDPWNTYAAKFLDKRGVLVCDEAHALRNWSSKRTKGIIRSLSPHAGRLYFITATPKDKGANELHPMYSAIEPGKWGKYGDFCKEFCHKIPMPKHPAGFVYKGTKNEAELLARSRHFILRRFQADVQAQLPPVTEQNIFLSVPSVANQLKELFGKKGTTHNLDPSVSHALPDEKDPSISTARKFLGIEKVPAVIEFIEETRETLRAVAAEKNNPDGPPPIIVYAYHLAVIESIRSWAQSQSIRVAVIQGDTSTEDRATIRRDFQKGAYDLLIINIETGSEGITLTRSHVVIFAEHSWSGRAMSQAVGRVNRHGQKHPVLIYYLVAKGSLDQRTITTVRNKMRDFDKLFSPQAIQGEKEEMKFNLNPVAAPEETKEATETKSEEVKPAKTRQSPRKASQERINAKVRKAFKAEKGECTAVEPTNHDETDTGVNGTNPPAPARRGRPKKTEQLPQATPQETVESLKTLATEVETLPAEHRAHAVLAPSASKRQSTCLPSIIYDVFCPDEDSSEFASEGTRAHDYAEYLLDYFLHNRNPGHADPELKAKYDEKMAQLKAEPDNMFMHVTTYVQRINKIVHELIGIKNIVEMHFEKRVHFSENIYGTVDVLILYVKDGEKRIFICDLKYGRGVFVSEINNTQLTTYLLGALEEFKYKAKKAIVGIYQPRALAQGESADPLRMSAFSEDAIKEAKKDIKKFERAAKKVLDFAHAQASHTTYPAVAMEALANESKLKKIAKLHTGDHCRFCPGKALCAEFAKEASVPGLIALTEAEPLQAAALAKRPDSTVKQLVAAMSPEQLAAVLDRSAIIKEFLKAVESFAVVQLQRDAKSVPNYKVVAGQSRRRWIANTQMIAQQLQQHGINPYEQKLRAFSHIEAEAGENSKVVLDGLLDKPEGSPKLKQIHENGNSLADIISRMKDLEMEEVDGTYTVGD